MSESGSGSSAHPLLVVAALIEREGEFLVAQRPVGDWMEGYWEFPGGKLGPDEDPRVGLEREIEEELAIRICAGAIEEVLLHRYPDRTVLLLFFRCQVIEGEPVGCLGQDLRWASPAAMKEMMFLPADWPLVELLSAKHTVLDTRTQAGDLPRT